MKLQNEALVYNVSLRKKCQYSEPHFTTVGLNMERYGKYGPEKL